MNKYSNLTISQLVDQLQQLEQENILLAQKQKAREAGLVLEKSTTSQAIADLISILLGPESEDKINQALIFLLKYFEVDRAYIAWYNAEKHIMRITDEMTENNLFSIVDDLEDMKPEVFPWWFDQILNGKDIVLSDIEQIPNEAINEKELLNYQKIVSLIVIPLFSNGKPYGFIGLDSVFRQRDWTILERENLRTLADILLISLEKRETHEKMLQSEQQFRVLHNNMPLGYLHKRVIRDKENNPIDFEYVDANKAVEQLLGFSKENIIEKNYYQFIAPLLTEDIYPELLAVLQSKAPIIKEKYTNLQGRLLKLIIYSPSPEHVITLWFEISSDIRLEEEILKSEAKFKIVFDKLPLGVELYDANGRLIDMNQADEEIFGVKRISTLGVNIFDNPALPTEKIARLKHGEEVDIDITYQFTKIQENSYYDVNPEKRNATLRLFIKCIPLKDIHDKIFGFMVIVNDETEKYKKAEETEEMLTKLKTAVGYGDSLMWEYDVNQDKMHVDLELTDSKKISKLKTNPFVTKNDFYNIVHSDDKEYVCDQHFERLIKGEIGGYNIQYKRLFQDGYLWVRAHVQPYKFNESGMPVKILYYLSDITDEINMQAKLRSIEDENRKIGYAVEKSQDEIYALNAEGQFVFTNKRVFENYNFQGSCTNFHIWDINPEYSKEKWNKLMEALRAGQTTVQQTIHKKADGKTFPTEIYIYPTNSGSEEELFWCFARDITERIHQHEQIVSLNSMMETILDNVPVSICVKDIKNNFNIVFFNKAAELFLDKRVEEVIGKNDFFLYNDMNRAVEIRKLDTLAIQDGGYNQYAVDYVIPSGEHRVVNSIRIPILTNEVNSMMVILIWDITEQRKNEVELIKVKEADKLKSTFLANMSHEIRTPLNAIVGFSNIVAETEDIKERESYIEIINKNNELLLQLIDDILDFSKIESGTIDIHKQPLNIKEICEEMYAVHALKMPAEIQFNFDKNQPPVKIYSDPKRVTQVISNFLTNAVKFTPRGEIKLAYKVIDSKLYISVTDTGIGITEDKRKYIFERFVKLDSFKQGAGLGLPISKIIIEKMGGEIGFYSTPGKGSTFWFTLPIQEKDSEIETLPKPVYKTNECSVSSSKQFSILIAEDVEENYHLLEVLLKNNYTLYHANNGEEAIELYKKHSPDLILMDIKMPKMNGFEATRIIRDMSNTIPIFALTAFAQEKEKEIAKECQFDKYIVKPINTQQLRDTVNNFFSKKESR